MRGFKTIRRGWMDPFYKPKPKPVHVPRTAEQIAEDRAANDRWVANAIASMSSDSNVRAITKLVDREARVAVEGDTDLNHDNVEAAE